MNVFDRCNLRALSREDLTEDEVFALEHLLLGENAESMITDIRGMLTSEPVTTADQVLTLWTLVSMLLRTLEDLAQASQGEERQSLQAISNATRFGLYQLIRGAGNEN